MEEERKEERIGVWLPADLVRRIKILAIEEGTTMKDLVQEALENLLRERGQDEDIEEPALLAA